MPMMDWRIRTEQEALALMAALDARFAQCELQMHPDKTKIVYCKDGSRKKKYPVTQFDFLGYTFMPRPVKNSKRNSMFVSFTPAVSNKAVKAMRQTTRKLNFRNRTQLSLADISRLHNPAGLVAVLRKILPLGNVSRLQAFQQNAGGVGDEEVQAAERPQDTGKQVFRAVGGDAAVSLRTLAERNDRCVCLMGAV